MSKGGKPESVRRCPCDSNLPYTQCCAPLHEGAPAPSAEALMRSRYSAYVLGLRAYLLASWHASTRPSTLPEEEPGTCWLGLRVVEHQAPEPDLAYVAFIARYRVGGGSAQRLQERSRFRREQGHWFYVDGEFASR